MDDRTFRNHLDQLKTAVPGSEVAGAFGLSGKGKRYFCPECQAGGGKTPDLAVSAKGFKCFKCGSGGDVIDLVVMVGRMSKAEAIRWLEDHAGIASLSPKEKGLSPGMGRPPKSRPEPSLTAAVELKAKIEAVPANGEGAELYAAFLQDVCRPLKGTPGAKYLTGRGIAAGVADRAGIRYCNDLSGLWELADRKRIKAAGLSSFYVFQKERLPFLVFPYIREGTPVFIKGRSLLSKDDADRQQVPRFLNTGGQVPCLWNHDAVAGADQVMICEGEIDALTAIIAGYAGVGLPGWSHWKTDWTKDFTGKDVILVLDGDEAGRKGAQLVAESFIRTGLSVPLQIVLDEGKDLNDVFHESMKERKTTEG